MKSSDSSQEHAPVSSDGRLDRAAIPYAELRAAAADLCYPQPSPTSLKTVVDALPWLLSLAEGVDADKARLDFLDEANRRLNAKYGTTYRWRLVMNHNVNRLFLGNMLDVDLVDYEPNGLPSCRDAIDERMREVRAARVSAATGDGGPTQPSTTGEGDKSRDESDV